MNRIFYHPALIGLLGLSLLLKALVPSGFMPDIGALSRGVVRMTICSADGAQTLLVDKNYNKFNPQQQKHGHDKDGGVCPFASAPVFTPQTALLIFAFLLLIAAVVIPPLSIHHIRAALNRAAQSRAPPLFS